MKLQNKHGEIFEVNIFLMVLGYSMVKYLELTIDKNQDTLITSMTNGFNYFGGVPKEIIFDNTKTVIDYARTTYQNAVINETFY